MNVRNLVLGVGIFVVYLLVLNYGIEAFYPSPQYENYCGNRGYYDYAMPYEGKTSLNVTCSVSPTPQEQKICNDAG